MPRLFAIAVGGGALAAALHLSILAGGPGALILAYLTQLPLFLVGFSLGVVPVAAASATAALMVALVTGGMVSVLAFVITNGAPTLLVTAQALRSRTLEDGSRAWYSAGHILAEVAAYGSLIIVGLGIVFSGDGGFEAAVKRLLDVAIAQMAAGASAEMRANLVSLMAGILPGAAIAWWLLMVVGNATLAHAVLARFGKALRPKPSYPDIEMPGWTAYVFLAAMLVMVIGRGSAWGYVAINILPVWVLAYGLLGLATVHTLSHRWRHRGLALGALYTAIIVLGWPIALVAGFGFIEQWACFRRQVQASPARRD
ncbi:MAG: DUF2232 domain-containing protein [Alphaproteobacteria bacterium]